MRNIIKICLALTIIFSLNDGIVNAQTKNRAKQNKLFVQKGIVVDEAGSPVAGAEIISGEGATTVFSGKDGSFTIKAQNGSKALIEAPGYESAVIDLIKDITLNEVVLGKAPLYTGERDKIELPLGVQEYKRNIVGSVSRIDAENLMVQPNIVLTNALQGRLAGLGAIAKEGGLANNPASLYIRGLHREDGNNILTIVDGMERPIDDLLPEEIENIEVMRDATAKILYGARATNGVLLLTTKHGAEHKRIIKASAEYGIGSAAAYPEFLNAHDYAALYNEARLNDGLEAFYSQKDLDGYANSSGVNDLRYPDVDYYDYFLGKSTAYRKLTTEFSGGNQLARYAIVAGYSGADGLQKIGDRPDINRINIRGNLDIKVNDMISAFLGVGGRLHYTKNGMLNHSQLFSAISSHRPNEYPLVIDQAIVPADTNGLPALGASFQQADNVYGQMVYGGYKKDQYVSGQTNFGLNFDLDVLAKGLSAKAYVAFDNYFSGSEVLTTDAATYAQRWIRGSDGQDSLILVKRKETDINDNLTLDNSSNFRSSSMVANVNYKNNFGLHRLNSDLSYFYYIDEAAGSSQDVKTLNYVLRNAYSFNNKYLAELTLAYMGSNRFTEENRFKMFYAGGLGWIVSEEDFFSSGKIDYLKLKATAGLLGYDRSSNYFLYENRWSDNGNYTISNGTNQSRTNMNLVGNPNLDWEKNREVNVGVEALGFNKRLLLEADYFNELRYDIVRQANSQYPGMFGGLYPFINFGKVANQGIDLIARWKDNGRNLFYDFGVNLIWSKNKVILTDEVEHPDDYLRQTGSPSDAMFGYVSEGLFGKDVPLDEHAIQTFGPYGEGDIAYKDLNDDGIIDDRDRKMIGNNFPRTQLGIDLNLNYKGWGLYMLTTAQLGVNSWLNNTYYWNRGENKYSIKAQDRYHPVNNPEGSYPKLTTTTGSNNFMNSDFWIENSSFVRLKNIELSYTLRNNPGSFARKIKLFARGSNLLTFSKIKDLDPEALNAGISNYPLLKNVSGGLIVSF